MKKIFTISLTLAAICISAQDLVLIKFNDKPSADTYFDNPLLMLSQKALDRRDKYNIELNMQDVPVEASYVTQVEDLGIEPIAVSKWFNGVFAWLTETQVDQVSALSFVQEVDSFLQNDGGKMASPPLNKFGVPNEGFQSGKTTLDFDYGFTEEQITQLNLDYLHNLGFTGEGITIAILDAGFPEADNISAFDYIRDNGQIKGGYNFVDDNDDYYTRGDHGTMVLSTIGGYIENEFVGTAIDADFYLFITENVDREMPDEEVFWIEGAERADSIGADVINTSLGYSEFDDSRYDYTYEDMNGETAYITRGAQIAAEKGIMVVNSAGNSGNDEWHYITAPADGIDVFTIGAVDSDGDPAGFSSYGPTADGRIKPDVDARGSWAAIIRTDGNIDFGSGTSFSSPIMAGAMACFIQAYPNVNPMEMRQTVRESANHFNNPTNQMGYGIPDFEEAYNDLLSVTDVQQENAVSIYPNPTSGVLNIQSEKEILNVQLISVEGKIVRKLGAVSQLDLNNLPNGIYILKVQFTDGKSEIRKVVKK
jgi:subtilisin family serine protease